MSLRKPNPDKVSGPVVLGAGVGVIIAAVLKAYLDVEVNPADAEQWWNWFTGLIVPLLPAIGAWLGGLRAKRQVTPVTKDATPRDLAGNDLAPVTHTETTGYPPTRAATPEERLPRRPLKPPFEAP